MLSHSMSSQTVDKPSSQRSFCCPKARESVALMLQVKLSLLNDNDTIRLRRVSRIEAHPPFHGIRKSSQSAYFSKCDYRQLRPFLGVGEKRPDIMLTIFTFSGKLLVGWNLAERSVAYALHHERFREGRFFCDAGVSGRNCDRTETGGAKPPMLEKLREGTSRNYVSLDDLTERTLAQTDPQMFFQLHKPPILIDEVQYAPQLFIYIKIMVDQSHRAGDFWLTGSQAFKLMTLAGESLAGRACVLHLNGLSQKELYGSGENQPFSVSIDAIRERIAHREAADTPAIFERIFRGSMPAFASGAISNRSLFYSSYLQTYIERDVRELDSSIEATEFLRFITGQSPAAQVRWSITRI